MLSVIDTALSAYRDLADQHGLHDWKVELDTRSTQCAGRCWYKKKKLTIARWFILQAPPEEVRNTMLHEIAHALAGPTAKHGPDWKRVARSIGCTGERCHKVVNVNKRPLRFKASCVCGEVHYRDRPSPRHRYRCLKSSNILQWVPNDGV